MDISSAVWLSELEMDDPMVSTQNWMSSCLDHDAFTFKSCESYSAYQSFNPKGNAADGIDGIKEAEMVKPNNLMNYSCNTTTIPKRSSPSPSSSSVIRSFDNADEVHGNPINRSMKPKNEIVACPYGDVDFDDALGFCQGSKRVITRTPSQAQDHVLAERYRRERLAQRFIALSALLPGLKTKMDKASILGDAAIYIKQLQERVNTLEEKAGERERESSVVSSLKRSRRHVDHEESSSSDDNFDSSPNGEFSIPEIEVGISERNVLFRVLSKKIPRFTVRLLSEIEKLHMTIISSSVMPFSNTYLLITIIAQMDAEFCMTVNDLVKNLQLATPELTPN